MTLSDDDLLQMLDTKESGDDPSHFAITAARVSTGSVGKPTPAASARRLTPAPQSGTVDRSRSIPRGATGPSPGPGLISTGRPQHR